MNLPTFTLLIVEDAPENRELYRNCLLADVSCAYDLLEAESVAQGLKLCQTRSIDAVLLDYLLPDGDGLKFLQTLSEQINKGNPVVVMVTGYGDESIAVRAMKLGAQDYLPKHKFSPQILVSTMRGAIENARLRLQLQQSEERLQTERLATEREWIGLNRAALEHRNQELQNFVHSVSHDLKAPLRAIANLSKWIEEDLNGALTVGTQQQMTLLRSRVDRMSETIDGLLDHALSSQMDGASKCVSVASLLAEVIDSLSPPLTFSIEIDLMPLVTANRVRLFQVFANLIGNAIEHHPRSDGSIHIAVRELADRYEFSIADDGVGIAPEQHERIFGMFEALNPQNRPHSTGMGLAIVKKVIESQGGSIWLESEIGKGTTFYFTWIKRSN